MIKREKFNEWRSLLANGKVDVFLKETEVFYKNNEFGTAFQGACIQLHQASTSGDYEGQSNCNNDCLYWLAEILCINRYG